MARRIILVLVIVILGSVALQELLKTLEKLAPILIVIAVAIALGGGWFNHKRKF